MTPAAARQVALALDLDGDALPICQACLSFVSFEIDGGDERKIRGATGRMTPDIWAEELELPARAALERALDREVPGAAEALAEVAACGARSGVARAIVRVLAEQQSERSHERLLRFGLLPSPSPAEPGSARPPDVSPCSRVDGR